MPTPSTGPGRQEVPRPALIITAARGRLRVRGPRILARVPGAVYDSRRDTYDLSLTMPTLRAIRALVGLSKSEFARCCAPEVLRWARFASADDAAITDLRTRLEAGWRMPGLRWPDMERPEAPRAPFQHQEILASAACSLDGTAFIAETGAAKTRAAVVAMTYQWESAAVDRFVVVCPSRVMGTWVRQVRMWSDRLTPIRLEGSVAARDRLIRTHANTRQPVVLILNYEVLAKLLPALQALGPRTGFVMDEMHRLKNPNALVSKAATQMAITAPWRLGLTGTPVTNRLLDVWQQWFLLDLGLAFGANYVQFRREFFDENPWSFELTPKVGSAAEIRTRMHRRGWAFRKADCLDLPPKLYERREVELTREQSTAYSQMMHQLVAEIERGEGESSFGRAANTAVRGLRLSQITSGFLPLTDPAGLGGGGGLHRFTPNPKMDATEELVREHLEEGASVIVWAWYNHDIQLLRHRLADLHPAAIYGGVSLQDSDAAELAFQSGQTKVLIGNPASGGSGITLTAASVAIYYSQNWDVEKRLQSEDRCHRPGSEVHAAVTYIDMVCRRTIDELISSVLEERQDMAHFITDLRHHLGIPAVEAA